MANNINGLILLNLDEQSLTEELNMTSRIQKITLMKEIGKLKNIEYGEKSIRSQGAQPEELSFKNG